MRISDWSSDVCSSDLAQATLVARALDRFHETFGIVDVVLGIGTDVPGHALMMVALAAGLKSHVQSLSRFAGEGLICGDLRDRRVDPLQCLLAAGKVNRVRDVRADLGAGDRDAQRQIGRASCRERVCQYV